MNDRVFMSIAMAFCLGLVWLAYQTGFRQGRETSPEFYAFQGEKMRADREFWAMIEASDGPDQAMCQDILAAAAEISQRP